MDFSKTKIYQRTRSCYEKIYMEFNKKKKSERICNGGDDLISESGGDRINVVDDDDDDGLQLSNRFRKKYQRKINVERVSGSGKNKKKFEINQSNRVCLGAKNHKRVATSNSQKNSENDGDGDDAFSYMGDSCKFSKSFGKNGSKSDHVSGKIENNLKKGFVKDTAASNGYISLDESEDDEGIIYLD